MARFVKVEMLQKHLEIDFLEGKDEDYLDFILRASENRIEKAINRPLSDFVENDTLNESLTASILIFAGTLYANREAVAYTTATPIPYTLSYLIQPFIKY